MSEPMAYGHGRKKSDSNADSDTCLLHTVASGNGPPLVLIHGVAGSHMVWDHIVPFLEPYCTVIRMDLLGYGHSPKPRGTYTPYRHVAAIRSTLDQRGIVGPLAIVGLSMGTNLMLEYALRWPDQVREMIGIGFPFYSSEADARVGLKNNAWTRLALERPMMARVLVPTVWWLGRLIPGLISRQATIYTGPMAKDALRARYTSFRSSLIHCMVEYRLEGPLKASGQVRRLFIHGDDDQWSSTKAVQQAIRPFAHSDLRSIGNAPHNLAVAEPALTATLMLEFLGVRSETE
jgi:pimeloyl-ACP methyl ester carboxylesterase